MVDEGLKPAIDAINMRTTMDENPALVNPALRAYLDHISRIFIWT